MVLTLALWYNTIKINDYNKMTTSSGTSSDENFESESSNSSFSSFYSLNHESDESEVID